MTLTDSNLEIGESWNVADAEPNVLPLLSLIHAERWALACVLLGWGQCLAGWPDSGKAETFEGEER